MSTLTFKQEEHDLDCIPDDIDDDVKRAVWIQNRTAFIQESDAVESILVNYVQPDSTLSLDDAVHQVAQFWHEPRPYFNRITPVAVPTYIICQIPYDHPAHKKLAEFMLALHDSGLWIAGDATEEQRIKEQRNMWIELEGNLVDLDWRTEDDLEDEWEPIQYANFCAFVANLVSPAYYSERFIYVLAKQAMDDAIRLEPTLAVEIRDARVIAAAQYIDVQAQTIFNEVITSRKLDAEQDAKEAREAARGCFSRLVGHKRRQERDPSRRPPSQEFYWNEWQDWKHMFQSAAADETHGKECRDIAQKAADMMTLQEKINSDRLAGL